MTAPLWLPKTPLKPGENSPQRNWALAYRPAGPWSGVKELSVNAAGQAYFSSRSPGSFFFPLRRANILAGTLVRQDRFPV